MLSDLGQILLAIYFSSFLFIIIPVLGAITGAITALMMRTNFGLGLLVGLTSGIAGLGLAMLSGLIVGRDAPEWTFYPIAFGLPIGGAFAPIAILQVLRLRHSQPV